MSRPAAAVVGHAVFFLELLRATYPDGVTQCPLARPCASSANGCESWGDRFLRNGATASRALVHHFGRGRCSFACEMIGDPLVFLTAARPPACYCVTPVKCAAALLCSRTEAIIPHHGRPWP
ncbi:hypothetical protein MRX96_023501 [Rhipicephalus microplus]